MDRIDLRDKFFHGILVDASYENKNELVIKKLKNILDSDRLYCRQTLIKMGYSSEYLPFAYDEFWNDETELCLACYPNFGKYSYKYAERIPDAYRLFANRIGFIFDDSVLENYQFRKGKLNNEYYLTGDLEVSKYLVGLKGPGLEICRNLKIIYYYFKYYNGEISLEEFMIYTGEAVGAPSTYYDLNKVGNVAEVVDLRHWAKYLPKGSEREIEFKVKKPEDYLDDYYYDSIEKIASDYGVKLYDNHGVLINDRTSRLEQIKEMIDYVLEQYDKTNEVRKVYLIKKLNIQE